ncbi:MAG: class I SAM-dependent methyltransferase [Thermoleophilaceae bacterium]
MASAAKAREAVASVPLWYHTLEVAPGVTTPGWFDLRPIVDKLPWPDVRGKRCLDLGTYDGFLAFEMERRGAREVVAADVADHEHWDWPVRLRARGVEYLRTVAGPEKGVGLRVATDILGSSVQAVEASAYDLSPEFLGTFDVVVCGSLLLHLREPLRALEAIRSVCSGHFLSTNQVDPRLTVFGGKAPLARLEGMTDLCQWWVPNPAGHRHMLTSMGFALERETGVYAIPFGPSHPVRGDSPRERAGGLLRRVLAGNDGVLHHAALVRPEPA